MAEIYEGQLQARPDARFAVIVSRYNDTITGRLLDGTLATFEKAGVASERIEVAWVPGAWELPLLAARQAHSGWFAAVVCLGAVIRGETTHDQYINQQVSSSLGQIALDTGLPVIFGVLTCNTLEQALQRAGGSVGHKGVEAAEAALRMADLLTKLPRPRR